MVSSPKYPETLEIPMRSIYSLVMQARPGRPVPVLGEGSHPGAARTRPASHIEGLELSHPVLDIHAVRTLVE